MTAATAFLHLLIALAAALTAAPARAQQAPRFAILEFEVEGNSVLPVTAIEQAVMPFMGEARELADVEKAREALERAYQQAGYLTVFVDVPEQRVDAGVVRLNVTEGRVDRLRVTGSRYYSQGVIRERVAELAEGKVPNFNAVQQQVATLQRPERQLQPVLRPGREPGTVEAELKVTDQLPLSGSVELTNRHAPDTSSTRLSATLRYDNLFQRDHAIALTAIVAPQALDESKVLVANYSAPLDGGDTLVGYVVVSDSLLEPLGAVSVVGKGVTVGVRWLRSFYLPGSSHSLVAGADFKRLDQRTDIADLNAVTNPLRYVPLQLGYTGQWVGELGQSTLNTSFVFGVKALLMRSISCTDDSNLGAIDQFQCSRNGADGGFAYWRGDARHTLPLGGGSLSARLGWQLASQPLVSGEQYTLGGAETVRGYLEAEAAGDHALLGSLEWRSANLLGTDTPAGAARQELALLAFLDAARATTINPFPGQPARVPLLGRGLGLRLKLAPGALAEVDLAWPRKRTAATTDGSARLHVRLLAQF
ncbi:POTRA domain-containing protein [Aquincola sp. J276]|uniref:ShlB/FhaC/HecB family hemolysin secretion/activation protein n=1 Tax=Aquincola sp. J276 TaxID=2898432 RepID=UPI0021511A47|nr:POTRA domain-containing protein [Aquincola sp. J276]MCR5867672.1 ShlB/FhaC/HecB family hemolysin secretion/activation protein [Aquincola sp. J276]